MLPLPPRRRLSTPTSALSGTGGVDAAGELSGLEDHPWVLGVGLGLGPGKILSLVSRAPPLKLLFLASFIADGGGLSSLNREPEPEPVPGPGAEANGFASSPYPGIVGGAHFGVGGPGAARTGGGGTGTGG